MKVFSIMTAIKRQFLNKKVIHVILGKTCDSENIDFQKTDKFEKPKGKKFVA